MAFNLSSLQADTAKVRDGVVFNLGTDAWIRLAPIFGPRFREAWKKITRGYRRRFDSLPERQKRDLRLRALALGCILDWSGLTYTDDEGVEQSVGAYTPQKAYKILNRLPGFVQEVEERASDWSNYR